MHRLHHNAGSLLFTAPQTIDLSLELDDGRLPLSLEILDYIAFALTMQLQMRHVLCWNVPSTTPLEISFYP
jgi:hypothetical protein